MPEIGLRFTAYDKSGGVSALGPSSVTVPYSHRALGPEF